MIEEFQKRAELEARIDEYMSESSNDYTKLAFEDIEELRGFEWSKFAAGVRLGEYKINQYAPSPMVFEILADPAQKSAVKFFNFAALVTPFVAIGLAFAISLWFLAALIMLPVFRGAAKSAYNEAVLKDALISEKVFSFLFSRGTVCITGSSGVIFRKAG